MEFPDGYKYSKEHTWLKVLDNGEALIGITDFAQKELNEIVYVDLPSIGKQFKKDDVFGSVEAVKTTSDLFIPISGEIIGINDKVKDNAELVNSSPFNEGWMVKIRIVTPSEVDSLLDAKAYESIVQ